MISSSDVPVTGSKYFHSECHEDDVDEIQRSPRGGITCRDTTEIKKVFVNVQSNSTSPRGAAQKAETHCEVQIKFFMTWQNKLMIEMSMDIEVKRCA